MFFHFSFSSPSGFFSVAHLRFFSIAHGFNRGELILFPTVETVGYGFVSYYLFLIIAYIISNG
jgi:hypothetical protein